MRRNETGSFNCSFQGAWKNYYINQNRCYFIFFSTVGNLVAFFFEILSSCLGLIYYLICSLCRMKHLHLSFDRKQRILRFALGKLTRGIGHHIVLTFTMSNQDDFHLFFIIFRFFFFLRKHFLKNKYQCNFI